MATTKKTEATNTTNVKVVNMTFEKETKNTIRFAEVLPKKTAAPVIGTLYVPKSTLDQIQWDEGEELVISISVKQK